MADKPSVTTIAAGAQYDATELNDNFTTLRDEFANVLGKNGVDGASNTMSGNVDMDGNRIINLGAPTATSDAARLADVVANSSDASATAQLRVDLANSADNFGIDLVARGVAQDDAVYKLDTYTELRAFTTQSDDNVAIVSGRGAVADGGGGIFRWDVADLSTEVTADSESGVYVAPDTDLTGASGAWVRLFTQDVDPHWFGATGDATADDQTALQAAVDFLGTEGGAVRLHRDKQYLVNTDLTVGEGASIVGSHTYLDPREISTLATWGSQIRLDVTATINLSEGASLRGIVILPESMTFPQDATGVGTWTGNAITVTGTTHGAYIGYCSIAGFNRAITTAATNTAQVRCEHLNIDCTNGIIIDNGTDVAYVENCHCWPAATIDTPGVADADLQRSGAAFKFTTAGDWYKVTDCFSFGYTRGFVSDSCNSMTFSNCSADSTSDKSHNPIGFEITGTAAEVRMTSCQAANQTTGVSVNTTATLSNIRISGLNLWECASTGILVSDGRTNISHSVFRGGAMNGVSVDTADGVHVTECIFDNLTNNAINNVASTNPLWEQGNVYNSITGNNVVNPYVKSVASANPLVLDGENTFFVVTGTTGFGAISTAGDYGGKVVTLKFDGAVTVTDGTIAMAGSFLTTADDTLTLVSDGTTWYEVSRSVN